MRGLYAECEGCLYQLWPLYKMPTPEDFKSIQVPVKENQVEKMGILFHVIIWPDGTGWDAYNGFRTKISDEQLTYFEEILIPKLELEV